MTLWVIAWALWSLTVWYQVNFWLPARKAITECTHDHGRIEACNPRMNGRAQDLVWFCSDCPLQVPLVLTRVAAQLAVPEEHSLWYFAHRRAAGAAPKP